MHSEAIVRENWPVSAKSPTPLPKSAIKTRTRSESISVTLLRGNDGSTASQTATPFDVESASAQCEQSGSPAEPKPLKSLSWGRRSLDSLGDESSRQASATSNGSILSQQTNSSEEAATKRPTLDSEQESYSNAATEKKRLTDSAVAISELDGAGETDVAESIDAKNEEKESPETAVMTAQHSNSTESAPSNKSENEEVALAENVQRSRRVQQRPRAGTGIGIRQAAVLIQSYSDSTPAYALSSWSPVQNSGAQSTTSPPPSDEDVDSIISRVASRAASTTHQLRNFINANAKRPVAYPPAQQDLANKTPFCPVVYARVPFAPATVSSPGLVQHGTGRAGTPIKNGGFLQRRQVADGTRMEEGGGFSCQPGGKNAEELNVPREQGDRTPGQRRRSFGRLRPESVPDRPRLSF
ncbi:hypothetical protein HDU97_009771 [Phlyctochytrium planicorne]|nr:hypothetical protein HDU97_009771 [Phlyctochytrium planicorne]